MVFPLLLDASTTTRLGFGHSPWWLVLLGLLAAGFAVWSYRITVPPVSSTRRAILTALRALALFCGLVALFEPVLSLIKTTEEAPELVVLTDVSESMSLTDPTGNRREILHGLVTNPLWAKLRSGGAVVRFLPFGAAPDSVLRDALPDSLRLTSPRTNLADALSAVPELTRGRNLAGVVVLSDGAYTAGANPLYLADGYPVPLYTVGVGDSTEGRDVRVERVLAAEVAYVATDVPIDATIRASNSSGEKVAVVLTEDGRRLDAHEIALPTGSGELPVSFTARPTTEGTHRYTVAVATIAGEISTKNNAQTVFVRVLRSKLRLLVIAGAPSPEVGALRQAAAATENLEAVVRTQTRGGGFLEGPLPASLDSADAVVFVDYPTAASAAEPFGRLAALVGAGRKPLLTILGPSVDYAKLASLGEAVPVTFPRPPTSLTQGFLQPTAVGLAHPVFKLDGVPSDIWRRLPPLDVPEASVDPRSGSVVLGEVAIRSVNLGRPMIALRSAARRRSAVVAAVGLWRWRLADLGTDPTGLFYDRLIGSLVRWLTSEEETRRVRIRPTQPTFDTAEPVTFTGQVYDESFSPIADASVTVTATGPTGKAAGSVILSAVGGGRYEGALPGLPPGEYRYLGAATPSAGGAEIGREAGRFTVGDLGLEVRDPRMNRSLLTGLAQLSGGRFYTAQTVDRLAQDLAKSSRFAPNPVETGSEIELWNRPWLLLLMLALLTAEWTIRKLSGMV